MHIMPVMPISAAYAAEELVGELCAAFLCAEFSIDGDLRAERRIMPI
jgi:antirestriction protein ArdC